MKYFKIGLLGVLLLSQNTILLADEIHEAVKSGNIELVTSLLTADSGLIHKPDEEIGGTLLHLAAYQSSPEMITLLVEKGADVNKSDNFDGYPPVVWAISGKKTANVKKLIQLGADFNYKDKRGDGLLHFAALRGNSKIIEYFLGLGFDINARDNFDFTPVVMSVLMRNTESLESLIINGADLSLRTNQDQSPFQIAVSNNNQAIIRILLENGISINQANPLGDTALHTASYQGFQDLSKFLLESGADINAVNQSGKTPLDLAIMKNHTDLIDFLKEQGAQPGFSRKGKDMPYQKIGEIGEGVNSPVTVTIIYDNYVHQEGMKADWGFSCYVEGLEKNILFDTGTQSDLFLENMEVLKIDPEKVDIIILSHEHGDHTGGLFAFLEKKRSLPVFMPYSFSYSFVSQVEAKGANPVTVKEPVQIADNTFLCGEMGTQIKEHALAINTPKGLVVITGCSHPGIVDMLKRFKELLNKEIYLVFGGFHLMNKTDEEMEDIIQSMKAMGVQKCGATHCTGDHQIELFKKAFGENYVSMGVGNKIKF